MSFHLIRLECSHSEKLIISNQEFFEKIFIPKINLALGRVLFYKFFHDSDEIPLSTSALFSLDEKEMTKSRFPYNISDGREPEVSIQIRDNLSQISLSYIPFYPHGHNDKPKVLKKEKYSYLYNFILFHLIQFLLDLGYKITFVDLMGEPLRYHFQQSHDIATFFDKWLNIPYYKNRSKSFTGDIVPYSLIHKIDSGKEILEILNNTYSKAHNLSIFPSEWLWK